MRLRVLGLAGGAGVGKDTLARYLAAEVPYALTHAFATALKIDTAITMGIPRMPVRALAEKWRDRLVIAGCNVRETVPNYWVAKWEHYVLWEATKYYARSGRPVVIIAPDVRFLNEAECIKRLGGKLAWVGHDTVEHELEAIRPLARWVVPNPPRQPGLSPRALFSGDSVVQEILAWAQR